MMRAVKRLVSRRGVALLALATAIVASAPTAWRLVRDRLWTEAERISRLVAVAFGALGLLPALAGLMRRELTPRAAGANVCVVVVWSTA